ncbi:hypothetical protein [Streptomyces naphthomycinicus]|uniref:hypothetical protein n=1 Tax=Streptomyces naphthomycinicus TaxID=2872625 RepID=UPI001CED6404|nr:hypothetical protein [Streptomyces sp. TML10]
MLSFSAPDLREQIEARPEGTALIGISTSGQAIAVDLDAESPHVLVCTASGGGSTTMLRSLTAQFLHQDAHALVLDPKRISHLWAKALPTVTHRGNIAGIHDALVHLAAELERPLDGDLDDVPRLIVAVDATPRQLARYWETFRQKDDPKTPPAIAALEEALWVGRAARVHVMRLRRSSWPGSGTLAVSDRNYVWDNYSDTATLRQRPRPLHRRCLLGRAPPRQWPPPLTLLPTLAARDSTGYGPGCSPGRGHPAFRARTGRHGRTPESLPARHHPPVPRRAAGY